MADFISKHTTPILIGLGITAASASLGFMAGRRASRTAPSGRILFKAWENKDPLLAYITEHSLKEPDNLKNLRLSTIETNKEAEMLVDPLEAQFIRILLKSINAKRCIEVGVFTGYNSVSMASALPDDGEIIACDITDTDINKGKPYWTHAEKIKCKIGPASDTMKELIELGQEGTFDFVFIDADKTNYDDYYEKGLVLLRKGGFIAVDNSLWSGKVVEDESKHDETTSALHNLSKKIKKDERVEASLLQLGDGTYFCRKL